MKHSFAAVAIVLVALGFGAANAAAKGNGNSSSGSVAAAAHYSGTATAGPHINGIPHYYSGVAPYRPVVIYRGGNRTLVYPSVGVSTLHHQTYSNVSSSNAGRALQHSGNSVRLSGLNTTTHTKLDPQTSIRLRNWNGNISNTSQARLNHINNLHQHPDRHWWRNRCAAIIFFDWGWWGWYDGWWYPAWGYDPYSYYEYNEPIYGYGGFSPDQIVAGVQAALQQRGYYTYAVDGKMGPLTRAAIARYQRDQLLPISSGLDPATLGSLGVIR